MKYICLGYLEPGKVEGMTDDERNAMLDDCFEHNDHLRANGHLVAEVPLQPPETALTLYWKNGKVATTDGPYAETKEQLGGIQILEARDLNHAVQLISQLPGFKFGLGPVEIRPVADISEMVNESEQRRRRKDTSRCSQSKSRTALESRNDEQAATDRDQVFKQSNCEIWLAQGLYKPSAGLIAAETTDDSTDQSQPCTNES